MVLPAAHIIDVSEEGRHMSHVNKAHYDASRLHSHHEDGYQCGGDPVKKQNKFIEMLQVDSELWRRREPT